MSESKELLEATIKGLEEKLNQLNTDLRSKERELADVNKPVMTIYFRHNFIRKYISIS